MIQYKIINGVRIEHYNMAFLIIVNESNIVFIIKHTLTHTRTHTNTQQKLINNYAIKNYFTLYIVSLYHNL